MKYRILALILILCMLAYMEIAELKKQVKVQQKQIDNLCKATGNDHLCTYFISEDVKEYLLHLKNSGKSVEAIRKLRKVTVMNLVEAKGYIDKF